MREMLKIASSRSDKAELFRLEEKTDLIMFQNSKLKDIDSKMQSGVSCRIQKNGKMGFAYTKNLYDRKELLGNALDSLAGGVQASFNFPATAKLPNLHTYDSSIKDISTADIVEECRRVNDFISSVTKGQVNISAELSKKI